MRINNAQVQQSINPLEQNPNIVLMKREGSGTQFNGTPTNLRKIIFAVGDVVWPDWIMHDDGREIYLKYAEGCNDGEINIANKNFLDRAWPRVAKHLAVDGIVVYTEQD